MKTSTRQSVDYDGVTRLYLAANVPVTDLLSGFAATKNATPAESALA